MNAVGGTVVWNNTDQQRKYCLAKPLRKEDTWNCTLHLVISEGQNLNFLFIYLYWELLNMNHGYFSNVKLFKFSMRQTFY